MLGLAPLLGLFPVVLSYRQAILGAKHSEVSKMDIEKTMQFLLEQQARFDARQAQFEERMAEIVKSHAQFLERQGYFEERMTEIQNILQHVAITQERTNAILATLAEQHVELERSHVELGRSHVELERSHITLAEAHRETEQSIRALSDAQKVTEQNLSALMFTVDRHISGQS